MSINRNDAMKIAIKAYNNPSIRFDAELNDRYIFVPEEKDIGIWPLSVRKSDGAPEAFNYLLISDELYEEYKKIKEGGEA